MKVKPSERIIKKSIVDLEEMIETQDFEFIGNVCWSLNEMYLYHDNSCSENELARILLNKYKGESK